jgi:hypothetical protein
VLQKRRTVGTLEGICIPVHTVAPCLIFVSLGPGPSH